MKFPEIFRWNNAPRPYHTSEGDPYGFFVVPGRFAKGRTLKCMASSGGDGIDWEHVSVSLVDQPDKCPSWDEMCIIKDLFWDKSECVVQFHPAESDYVNAHAGCLHLWKWNVAPFPKPPSILVGPKRSAVPV